MLNTVDSHAIYWVFFLTFFSFLLIFFKLLPAISRHSLTHPHPDIDTYFQTIHINLLYKIQFTIFSLLLPILIFITSMNKYPPSDALFVIKEYHFLLLVFTASLFLSIFYFLLAVKRNLSLFYRHFQLFIDAPEPHNPILGTFFRSLPPHVATTLHSLHKEDFLTGFFHLFEQEPQPFPKVIFPSKLGSPVLTEMMAYLLIACNMISLYFCLLSIFHYVGNLT